MGVFMRWAITAFLKPVTGAISGDTACGREGIQAYEPLLVGYAWSMGKCLKASNK